MIIILGPTASGKTRLAVQVAAQLNGEIISADSRQVYRGMDIGTGKDLSEYSFDNQLITHHLIDILDAGEDYNVHRYQQDFAVAVADITNRQKTPIVCGGTGLYLSAVLNDFQFTAIPISETLRAELAQLTDDELRTRFTQTPSAYTPLADISTRKRLIRAIEISEQLSVSNEQLSVSNEQLSVNAETAGTWFGRKPKTENRKPLTAIFGLDLPVELRRQRITARLHHRLNNGMIQEVKRLLAEGVPAEKLIFYGLEYKFITQFLTGELTYTTMTTRLETAIHQFAKRQMTYFRKMERDGHTIYWLDAQQPTEVLADEIASRWHEKIQVGL
jgi:tRNA dimethylallyltransferase